MNEDQRKKYERLNERLNELEDLNKKIGRLAFYLNENNVEGYKVEIMDSQLDHMIGYRDNLKSRITKGIY